MYEVREPLEIELLAIAQLGEEWHKESAFSHMEYNVSKVAALLSMSLVKKEMFVQVMIEKQTGKVVGLMWAELQESYFGRDKVANDWMLGVAKEHRGKCTNALFHLVNNYRAWAIESGARRIYLATTTGVEPEKTEATFERLGFHKIGTIHEA